MLHVRHQLPIYEDDVLTICSEGQTGRILLNGVATIGGAEAMTIKTCTDACRAAGYTLAGAEYGQECCKPYHLIVLTRKND